MLDHLISQYTKTKWPFFLVRQLQNEGVFNKEEANILALEGKIRKREGMHGDLIELIIEIENGTLYNKKEAKQMCSLWNCKYKLK